MKKKQPNKLVNQDNLDYPDKLESHANFIEMKKKEG
jgi:hypothetical protein